MASRVPREAIFSSGVRASVGSTGGLGRAICPVPVSMRPLATISARAAQAQFADLVRPSGNGDIVAG
jgi:hypothetical protein